MCLVGRNNNYSVDGPTLLRPHSRKDSYDVCMHEMTGGYGHGRCPKNPLETATMDGPKPVELLDVLIQVGHLERGSCVRACVALINLCFIFKARKHSRTGEIYIK